MLRIGLISDTHGMLRPDVFERFRDVDGILHAGDIGPPELLDELEAIAPVTAVWGNTDGFLIRSRTDEVARLDLAGHRVAVTHGHRLGSPTPAGLRDAHPGAGIIIFGHTHRPVIDREGGVLVVNPGAAGTARFGIPPSVGLLELDGDEADVEILELRQ